MNPISSDSSDVKFEIGHVLFIDIVGYSKGLINEQSDSLQKLKEIVRGTEQFRIAAEEGKLLRLPTGDGGALVFRTTPEAPVLCAMEIAKALKRHPELNVRMGIHSGPVNEITDLNAQANIAGAGINIAQRVMDCGDAGHILVSRHVAEDLEHYPRWKSYLHELGECEVKHGVRLDISNLYSDEVGNSQLPKKFQALKKHRSHVHWAKAAISLLALTAVVAAFFLVLRKPTRSALSVAERIAVLPFENLSEEKANAFFTDGVQDEILTDLSKIAALKVISRTSVMQYKSGAPRNLREIGQQLGVAHLLEGSVQRSGNKVRVVAQLIDSRSDAHLWAQTYDRDLADVFAIQSEIAKTIAEQLQARLSPKEEAVVEAKPTNDLVAYDFYLRAMEIERNLTSTIGSGGAQSSKREIELLDQAVARDPNFVPALCRLANTHLYLFWLNDRSAPHVDLAKKALEAAARLQPDSGEVHFTRGLFYYRGSRDYGPALAEFALAQRSSPNDAYVPFLIAMVERRQGRWEESLQHTRQAVELDPHNLSFVSELASSYIFVRRYEESSKTLDDALAWKPRDFSLSMLRARNDLRGKADLGRWQAVVNGGTESPAEPADLIGARLDLALLERDYRAAEQALDTPGLVEFDDNGFFMPREWVRGKIARGLGDKATANEQFLAARQRAAAAAQENPDDARALILLGQIDAALGRKDAIREGEHAAELLPPSKDSINGGFIQQQLAGIYAQAGDANRAFSVLEKSCKIPAGVTYGSLKLEEDWVPLRHDPRFEKIVQSLAPKE